MDPYANAAMQASTSYGQFLSSSNPSSTHSSPRSFPRDLDPSAPYPHLHHHHHPHSQSYPIPAGNPYPTPSVHPHRRSQQFGAAQMASRSLSYSYNSTAAPTLQVSTNTSSEHDPNERTARPGNAHHHAAFHNSLSLSLPPMPDNSLVTPTAMTSGSSTISSMSSAGLSSGAGNVSSASSVTSSFADAQQLRQDTGDRATQDYIAGTPGLSKGLSRPLSQVEKERLAWLDRLKYFLATAPSRWHTTETEQSASNSSSVPSSSTPFAHAVNMYPGMSMDGSYTSHPPSHPQLNRFMLPSQEFVTCVLWNGLYHITGTDIVRALVFRFEAFGRPVRNMKKFEEGVFSDLRNLKPGVDACLEEPKSSFLDLLFKYQCIRTQKKQKVFYWFSVPHDRLFLDALDRDLKREKMGQEPTTIVLGEPAMSFTYDSKRPLYEQFSKALGAREGESEYDRNIRNAVKDSSHTDGEDSGMESGSNAGEESDAHSDMEDVMGTDDDGRPRTSMGMGDAVGKQLFGYPLFGGSSTYKQRRKKAPNSQKNTMRQESEGPSEERGRTDEAGPSGRYGSASHSRERSRLMPRYESIRHEFGPGSEDERKQSEASLSAADYFVKQAKGELLPADGVVRKPRVNPPIGDVNVYYSEGAPPVPPSTGPPVGSTHVFGSSSAQTTRPSHLRGRSIDQVTPSSHPHRHSYHGSISSSPFSDDFSFAARAAAVAAPYNQGPLSGAGPSALPPQAPTARPNPPPPAPVSSTAMYEQHGADGKIKAFVCPLFSCGRLFKRMEHLKRHLRTHTMERPFTCPRCKKRFSRSDNLNQHLRTHERTGSGSAASSSNMGENSNGEGIGGHDSGEWGDGMDDDREGSVGHGGDHSGGESEDEDWSRYAALGEMNNRALGLPGGDVTALRMAGPYTPDVQMRVLEASDVQEVHGDEEGLLMVSNHPASYYPVQSSALFSSDTGDFGSDAPQWARAHPSPAFSPATVPSPSSSSINIRSNRSSISSSPGNFLHQQLHGHSASSSMSSSYEEFAAAMSAPSHKASFDHGALYPPGMVLDDPSVGGGPIRRHRSMTPSHIRSSGGGGGEAIRRPGTANSGEFSSGLGGGGGSSTPGSVGSASSASGHRGYHPYAAGYNSSSRSGSAHSSPNVHNIPLGSAEYNPMRSSSRSSYHAPGGGGGGVMQVQEQMGRMMSMSGGGSGSDVAMGGPEGAGGGFGEGGMMAFRSDSPAGFAPQTESPSPFNIDLPAQFGGGGPQQYGGGPPHSATMPVQYTQQQQQHQQFGDPFYPPHVQQTL